MRHERSLLLSLLGAALVAACSLGDAHREAASTPARSPLEPSVAPSALPSTAIPLPTPVPVRLNPLAGQWLEELADGESLGFVSPPIGATDTRPVVVAVHGAGDRPDWACSEWRAIFGPRPFVVCPRGAPLGGAFVWRSADALKTALARAMSAVEQKYGAYVSDGPRVYAGFSQGAILGASIVEGAPETYPYVVFLEGLGDVGARRFTRAFKDRGGRRIVLACSQAGCEGSRRAAMVALEKAGIDAKLVYAGPIGHTINEPVIAAMRQVVPWLLEGDRRWSGEQ